MNIELIKPHIGARIHVERPSLCDDEVVRGCLEILEDRGVLVFPGIGLGAQEHRAFTNALGTQGAATRAFVGAREVGDDLFVLSLDTESEAQTEYVKASFFWHLDGILSGRPDPKAILLSAQRVASKGGQTEFANTVAAYEQLPDAEKDAIAGLVVKHTAFTGLRWVMDSPGDSDRQRLESQVTVFEEEQPLVWLHESGRKSLKLSITGESVVGMAAAEGRALLCRLMEWAAQPAFTYRHEWQVGDLVVWNNFGMLHRVIPYDVGSGRAMYRSSIQQARSLR
jgi:alpha-ketoglutarate-dependent taurine dioxygenase